MSTRVGGAFTIGFAGVPVDDCYAITRIVESLSDCPSGRWMVLNTNATDVILIGRNVHVDAMSYQVVARLGHSEVAQQGELTVSLPVTRDGLVAMLEEARQKLTPDYVPSTPKVQSVVVETAPRYEELQAAATPSESGGTWAGAITATMSATASNVRPGFTSSLGLPPFAPAPMDTLYQRSTARAPHYQARQITTTNQAPPPPSAALEPDGLEPAADALVDHEFEDAAFAPHEVEQALDLQAYELSDEAAIDAAANAVEHPVQESDSARLRDEPKVLEPEAERVEIAGDGSLPQEPEPSVLELSAEIPPEAEPPIFSPARASGGDDEWPGSSLRQRLMAHMSEGAAIPSSVAQFIGVPEPAEEDEPEPEAVAPAVAATAALGDDPWAEAAMAIYSIVQNSSPVIAEIDIAGAGTITVDFRYRAFSGDVSVGDLSTTPANVRILTSTATPDMPPAFALPGQSLDKLLWFIGLNAFHGASAPWLRNEDRYRLQRWPNFTEMNYQIDHMRMTALMGNAFFNAQELADASAVPVDKAIGMLNAYSLMGLLQVSAGQAPAAPLAVQATDLPSRSSGGLFSKLRKKLGL